MWMFFALAMAAEPSTDELDAWAERPPNELVWSADAGMSLVGVHWPTTLSRVGTEVGVSSRYGGLRARGEVVPVAQPINKSHWCQLAVGASCLHNNVRAFGTLAALGDLHSSRTQQHSVALSFGGGVSFARHSYGDSSSFAPWEARRLVAHPTAMVVAAWSTRLTDRTRLRLAADLTSQQTVRTLQDRQVIALEGSTLIGLRLGVENAVGPRASRHLEL